jgi:hypothetical protein
MHSAICAFDTHEQAGDAVAALERAGFARHDLHIERDVERGYVVVAEAQDEAQAQRAGALLRDLQGRELDSYEAAGSFASPANASAPHRFSPTAGPDLREPETEHAPGLRYADKDKPL